MSDAIFRLLAKRYTLPEWVLVPQVRDGTGFSATRTADAVAMNCYPSKGLEVHGFEFKTARGDWLQELRDGSKADAVAQHCDRWWIVATEDVVVRAELPKAWGLIVVKGDELRTAVAAPPLPGAQDGPLDRCFIASFLRGCLERAKAPTDEALRAARHEGEKAARKAGAEEVEREKRDAKRDIERALTAVREFEAASGIEIDKWHGDRCGEEFAAFQRLRAEQKFNGLDRVVERLRSAADNLDALRREVPELVGEQDAGRRGR